MRLTVTLAALSTAAVLMMPASSAQAGGLFSRDRDHARMWDMKCLTDLFRRDRMAAAPAAAPAPVKRAKPAK